MTPSFTCWSSVQSCFVPTQGEISMSRSSAVIELLRQRQDGICPECKQPLQPGEPVDVHHLVSVARGGTNDIANVQLTHARCNRSKGKGQKAGVSGPTETRYTPSSVAAIANRVAGVEGTAESQVVQLIAQWATSVGLRPRPSGGKTGGVYFDLVGSDMSVPGLSL